MIPLDRASLKTYFSTSKIILTCKKKKFKFFFTLCKSTTLSQATGKSKVLEGRLRGASSTIESTLSKEIEESQPKSTNKTRGQLKHDQI